MALTGWGRLAESSEQLRGCKVEKVKVEGDATRLSVRLNLGAGAASLVWSRTSRSGRWGATTMELFVNRRRLALSLAIVGVLVSPTLMRVWNSWPKAYNEFVSYQDIYA